MFSSNEIRLPSSFSVIQVSVNIKNSVQKDTTLLLFFLSKSPGGYAIFFRFIWVAMLVEFFYIGVPVVRTNGWSVWRCTVTWLPIFLG